MHRLRQRVFKASLSLPLLLVMVFPLLSQEKFRRSPPFPEPLRELRLPEIESEQLTNGLRVSLIRRANSPVITMQLIILAGEMNSPDTIPGLATFTANMFVKGAEDISSSDVEEIMDSIGGSLSTSTFIDYSVITFSFLEEYLGEALGLLGDMIFRPSFLQREIDNEKRNIFYTMRERENNPEYSARRLLLQLLFEKHPYSKAVFRENFIRNIDQKDIIDFFDRYYRPNNAHLLLTGNLNLNTAFREASHYLNRWRPKDVESEYIDPPQPSTKKRVVLIDLPQTKDVTLYLGNIICPRNTQDFFPFLVLNQVLGGTPNSRLFMNLRETKGYAYYAFSEVELFKLCGIFIIRARVRPEVVFPSLKASLDELERIINEEVSSFEIEQAKSYLLGNFPLKLENPRDFSQITSKILALSLGDGFWSKYSENLMLTSTARVINVAQKYPILTPVVIIAVDKNEVLDYLADFEKIEVFNSQGIFQYTISKGVE